MSRVSMSSRMTSAGRRELLSARSVSFSTVSQRSSSRERQDFAAFFQPRIEAMRGGPIKYAQALEAIDVCVAAAGASAAASPQPAAPAKKRATRSRPRR